MPEPATYTFYQMQTRVSVEAYTYSEARRMFYRRKGFFPDRSWEVHRSEPFLD